MSNGIGRISGPLLKDNLTRGGVDLAFETDLLYLEVNNNRIGVNTESPARTLNIEGTTKTIDLIVDNSIDAANVNINNTSTISTDIDKLYVNSNGEIIIPSIKTDNIQFDNNQLYSFTLDSDIEIRPTGKTIFGSNLDVTGNIHANGDITFGGSITFGNNDQDSVTLFSDVKSDIIPDQTDTYNLGFEDGVANKRWRNLFVKSTNASLVYADTLTVSEDINYNLRFSNAVFVSINGNNANRGNHQNAPYRNIKYALSQVNAGDTVFVFPGEYEEEFPLTVPQGVTVVGYNIRNTIVKPTVATRLNDAFLLNGETSVTDITVKGFHYNTIENSGYGFRFAPEFSVTSRSPYIQNVSVITSIEEYSEENFESSIYVDPIGLGLQFEPGTVTITKEGHPESLVQSWIGKILVAWFSEVAIYEVTGYNDTYDPSLWTLEFSTPFSFSNQAWGFSIYPVNTEPFIIGTEAFQVVEANYMIFRKSSLPTDFATVVGAGWTLEMNGYVNVITLVDQDPNNINNWLIQFNAPASTELGPPIFASPVIQQQIIPGPAPTLFGFSSNSVTVDKTFYSQTLVNSLVGRVAVIDRYPNSPLIYNIVSIETEPFNSNLWRINFDTTFDTSGWLKPISFYSSFPSNALITNDIWDTTGNSIGEKWVAWFKTNLPADFTTTVQPGWTINVAGTLYTVDYIIEDPVNTNQWRIYVTTSLVAGVGIPIFTPPLSSTIILPAGRGALVDGSAAMSTSKEASMLFHSCTFIVPNSTGLLMKNGVRVEWLNCFTYFADTGLHAVNGTEGFADQGIRFGAEIRSIGSANVYGTYGTIADGASTLMYLITHNFGYVGSGLNSSNDNTLVIQENEVVELNSGKIYYTSQSQDGDFRIGDAFLVDFEEGRVSFDTAGLALNGVSTIFFQGTLDRTYLESGRIETGDFLLENNTIKTLTRDFNLLSSTGETYFIEDVNVYKNLNVTENLSVDGNVFLGNQPFDTITINVDFTQDLYPKVTDTYDIGANLKRWKDFYVKTAYLQDIKIDDNSIATTLTDSDLILNGNGTGGVKLEQLLFRTNSILSYSNSNIKLTPNIDKNLVISGTYGLLLPRTTTALNLTGDLRFNNSLNQYEGFSSALLTLGGVYSSNKTTSVLAHPTNNSFNFTTNNITNTTLNTSTLNTVRFISGELVLDNNSLISTTGNISLLASSVNLGAVNFEDGTISSPINQILELTTINQGYVRFSGDKAIVFPNGSDLERPIDPLVGNTRFNSERGYLETWNGDQWVSVAGEGDLADSEFATESTFIWSIALG